MTAEQRRFVKLTLLFACVHYILLLLVRLIAQLAVGVPPSLANVDRLIFALTGIQQTLSILRTALRAIWPGDSVPLFVNGLFTLVNSLTWGAIAALVRTRLRR